MWVGGSKEITENLNCMGENICSQYPNKRVVLSAMCLPISFMFKQQSCQLSQKQVLETSDVGDP